MMLIHELAGGLSYLLSPSIKRRRGMERIVILSGQVNRDNCLPALLNALFPECEIGIITGNTDSLEAYPAGSPLGLGGEDAVKRGSCQMC